MSASIVERLEALDLEEFCRLLAHVVTGDKMGPETDPKVLRLLLAEAGARLVAPLCGKFRCPRCGITSSNPTDLAEGYCGACHDWTAWRPTP